ncbi:uncharacterized protein LOC117124086 [Anneissia japonica]|uniref:uncharacterized protein LOC117124086 n=1 Tax=Anneissia japonica TaxID=1529436 RepID=UPI001425A1F1|nr:uncharacterized protein LOC117124086 [Anneissia japonica]XP_033126119.1 uncharacterized protein LOC117124086 [Anneissia japonica]
MTSFQICIIYIFAFSLYQATDAQVQDSPTDDTAYTTLNFTKSFLEQLFSLTYLPSNSLDYNNNDYQLPKMSEPTVDEYDPLALTQDSRYPIPTKSINLQPTLDPNSNWNEWNESNKSNLITSTMIAVAIALIVLIKLTLIALLVKRGRRLQRISVISSNQTSIPSEFENDSAHLVTPATIMYVEPQDLYNGNGVPSIPCSSGTPGLALMTPPPYSEASLEISSCLQQVEAPKDDYPPPAYQESEHA